MPEDLLELETDAIEGQETPTEVEQPVESVEQQQGEQGEADKTPITSLFQADGKKFEPKVLSALSKIKTENPELGKLLFSAMNRVGALDREFPGGLTEVRELRDKVDELGGLSGIQEKIEGAAELEGLAVQYTEGDPAFVDDLIESSPEAFAALAPVVFQKYAETNPEGFGAYIGRIVYGNMQESGIPLVMMRLADLVADKPQAVEALKQINAYLSGFKDLASKQVPDAKPSKAANPKNDDLSKREEALRSREWESARTELQREIVNGAYKTALEGRKPTSEERAQILELFTTRSAKLADRAFPGWKEKVGRYIKANDKTGYVRYMQTMYRRIVPEAIKSAVGSTLKTKAAPQVANTQQKPAQGAKPATAAAPAGFTPVAKEPDTFQIDYGRTTTNMIRNNQAILRDGKKVTWK